MGARKHFGCSYSAAPGAGKPPEPLASRAALHKGALASALGFIAVNAGLYIALHANGVLSPAIAMIILLVYAIIDVVFILFFCPYHVLFMRNRCCVSCRIYNWDYIMMCTPMILFPNAYSLSLFLLAAIVLIRWEISIYKNPHYFIAEYNENIQCKQCEYRLCRYRKAMKRMRRKSAV
jgi:hypothetical protein